jgi:hypothetical protein
MRCAAAMALTVWLTGCGGEASAPSMVVPPTAPTPAGLAGSFDLTFSADPACRGLPDVARARTYSVDVAPTTPVLTLHGGTFGGQSGSGTYDWNVVYQNVSTGATEWWFQDPEIWEFLGGGAYVTIYGGPARLAAADTPPGQSREWAFWGRFTYCPARGYDAYPECRQPEVICESSQHTLTLRGR